MRAYPGSIRRDVAHFDRKGIVPSRNVKSIDDYLREAETKAGLLEAFSAAPQDFIAENFGLDADFELVTGTEATRKHFDKMFDTGLFPAVLAKAPAYARLTGAQIGMVNKLNPFYCLGRRGEGGTILRLSKKSPLFIPIIKQKKKSTENRLQGALEHETVHAIRRQHTNYLADIRYQSAEEVAAYNSDGWSPDIGLFLRVCTPAYVPLLMWPYSVLAGIAVGGEILLGNNAIGLALATVLFSPIAAHAFKDGYYGNSTASFFSKAMGEGLNPHYLFLRSNPSEYSRSQSITDRLAKARNIRHEVMSVRLGIR